MEEKNFSKYNNLIDYGCNKNLLEIRSTGYEHYVPSPNAERVWCYERLADMADMLDYDDGEKWRNKAMNIKEAIIKNLWNNKDKWFDCLYPDGHKETIYSIQIFNLIKMNICSKEINQSLIKHVNDNEFLNKYGINSISKTDDLHYELNDPDWSGGGSYVGQGPALAQMLWNIKEDKLAYNVLRRFFWMGDMLPYYPQELYSNKPVPVNKAVNMISGLCGVQSIIYGMLGIKHLSDGSMIIDPNPTGIGYVELQGYKYNNYCFDIYVTQEKLKIICNNKVIYNDVPKQIKIEKFYME